MKHKTKLTDEQYAMIERMHSIGMNNDNIAYLIGISVATFQRMLKTDATLRDRMAKGAATASFQILSTNHRMITRDVREKEQITIKVDQNGKEIERTEKTLRLPKDPDTKLLMFNLQTKHGFKVINGLELSGANGDPIRMKLSKMTDEELAATIKKLNK